MVPKDLGPKILFYGELMDTDTFNTLLAKLQSATWTLWYPTNDTKMFTATINGQYVTLYNVLDPLYINEQKPDLNGDQPSIILDFVLNTLIPNFSTEIQDAIDSEQAVLTSAIDSIVGE